MTSIAPPAAPAVFPLADRSAAGPFFLAGFAWLVAAFMTISGVEAYRNDMQAPLETAQASAICAVLAGLAVLATARAVRILRRRPVLRVDGEQLVIDYPDVLREPLAIPRAAVCATHVDERGRQSRFPVPSDDSPDAGRLWWEGASVLPFLGSFGRKPNLALLLDPPVLVPASRRRSTVRDGEHVAGLLLRTRDAQAAARALTPARWWLEPAEAAALARAHDATAPRNRPHLRRRSELAAGWACALLTFLLPVLALGAAHVVIKEQRVGSREQASALGIVTAVVFAAAVYARAFVV